MRIPSAAVDYFVHPTLYDTTNARNDLGSLAIPRFRDYLPRLVDFVRAHPEIGSAAMACCFCVGAGFSRNMAG